MAVGRSALRLVLFGMPDAGKSSLLGALSQAAQTQEHLLNGHLTDLGQGLAEMRQRLYEGAPRQTLEELLPFPVAFEWFGTPAHGPRKQEAIVFDCDGRAANDLLSRRRPLDAAHADGTLGNAVLDADTLILAVDAAASPAQLETDFTEFTRFLRLLEHSRGRRTDIGGLPVFLVLTKCDLLAQGGDDLAAWVERIEERKRQVGQRFRDFLAHEKAAGPVPFGSIDLHLWATAVKRPPLKDQPPKPREPFGVAELFRQGFESAQDFRARRGHSSRRLLWTAAGTLGVVAFFAALAALLFATRPGEKANVLDLQVDRFRARQQELTPAARHRDVAAKLAELSRVRDEPAFQSLSADKRAFVENALRELTNYQEFVRQLDAIPDPREARSEEQLRTIRDRLSALVVPSEYQSDWEQTDAGRRRREWLADVDVVAAAAKATREAYEKLVREGTQVLERKNEPNLPKRAKAVLDQAQAVPNPRADRDRLIPGSRRVTYATVFELSPVDEVVRQWEEDVKKKLEPFARLEQS